MSKVLFIANGADVSASYNEHIAISHNQVDWQYFRKSDTVVKHHNSKAEPNYNKGRDRRALITLCSIGSGNEYYKFDCQDVSNGTGVGQHTGVQDGSSTQQLIMVNKIMGWI